MLQASPFQHSTDAVAASWSGCWTMSLPRKARTVDRKVAYTRAGATSMATRCSPVASGPLCWRSRVVSELGATCAAGASEKKMPHMALSRWADEVAIEFGTGCEARLSLGGQRSSAVRLPRCRASMRAAGGGMRCTSWPEQNSSRPITTLLERSEALSHVHGSLIAHLAPCFFLLLPHVP